MKILILVIYSEHNEENLHIFKKMVNIHRSYINNFEGVSSYFVQMRENQNQHQNQNVEIDKDFIYVKGEEKLLNKMHKTIEAYDYLINVLRNNYDYIVRTNISTIINIPKLKYYLNELPKSNLYTGGTILKLNWLDFASGIVDNSLFGTEYASGTFIIFTQDIMNLILQNKSNIRYDIVDDLSFGVFIKRYIPEIIENIQKYKTEKYEIVSTVLIPDCKINTDLIYYRNRIDVHNIEHSRYTDVYNMQKIVERIYNNL